VTRTLQRRDIKPGLTGWAQVNGYWDESNSFKVMRRRMEYDLYYIENWSLLLDMKIIVSTLFSKSAYLPTD
jgi:lipopolysaccharide/colanic/teichoic acid biosynthesis glycosyltransferase